MTFNDLEIGKKYKRTWDDEYGPKTGKSFRVLNIQRTPDEIIITVKFIQSGSNQTLINNPKYKYVLAKGNVVVTNQNLVVGQKYKIKRYLDKTVYPDVLIYVGPLPDNDLVFSTRSSCMLVLKVNSSESTKITENVVKFKSGKEINHMIVPEHWSLDVGDTLVSNTSSGNKYFEVMELDTNHDTSMRIDSNAKRIRMEDF